MCVFSWSLISHAQCISCQSPNNANQRHEQHAFGRKYLYEIVWEEIASTSTTTSSSSPKNGNANTKADDGDGPTKKKRRTIAKKKADDGDDVVTPRPPSGEQDGSGAAAATHRLCLRCRHCRDSADVLRPKSLSEHYFYSKICE